MDCIDQYQDNAANELLSSRSLGENRLFCYRDRSGGALSHFGDQNLRSRVLVLEDPEI